MDSQDKAGKINIDRDDLLDDGKSFVKPEKLIVNLGNEQTRSHMEKSNDHFPRRTKAGPYRKRKRNNGFLKIIKIALLLAGIGSVLAAFYFVGTLFFGSEPDIIAITDHSFRPTDPANIVYDYNTGNDIIAGELLIMAAEESTLRDIEVIASAIGGKVVGRMPDINLYQIDIPGNDLEAIYSAIAALETEAAIEAATVNLVPVLLQDAKRTPRDPQWTDWSADRRWGQDYINLPLAWALETGSSNVRVGIIEMGFDLEHVELQHMKVVMGNPRLWESALGYFGAPVFNHGNIVSGIIGALPNNKKGLSGVLWEADYYCYIIYSLTDFANAVEHAANNRVSILNISLIFAGWAKTGQEDPKLFKEANGQLRWLVNKYQDILFVQGAGNNPEVSVEHMPLACLSLDHDNVITVGAIDSSHNKASFSTYGEAVSIAAPGVDIWSTKSRDFRAVHFAPIFDTAYTSGSGTSFAAPFVSGVAGLLLSIDPSLKPSEVKRIIMENAQDHVFDDSQTLLGTGVVDAYAAVLYARGEPLPDEKEPVDEEINEETANDTDGMPQEDKQLDEKKYLDIVSFMEKATSNIVEFLPEFSDPNEIDNDQLIFLLIFNDITPSTWDTSDHITRFAGEDVEWAARTIFGSSIKNITHRSVSAAIWEESEQEYHIYAFGPTSFTENHVINIFEEPESYLVDVVHLLYYYGDYDRPDETDVYDEYSNLITVLKEGEQLSAALIAEQPIRRYVLSKTREGGFYISKSMRLP